MPQAAGRHQDPDRRDADPERHQLCRRRHTGSSYLDEWVVELGRAFSRLSESDERVGRQPARQCAVRRLYVLHSQSGSVAVGSRMLGGGRDGIPLSRVRGSPGRHASQYPDGASSPQADTQTDYQTNSTWTESILYINSVSIADNFDLDPTIRNSGYLERVITSFGSAMADSQYARVGSTDVIQVSDGSFEVSSDVVQRLFD